MSGPTRPPPDLLSMPNEILESICTYAVDNVRNDRNWQNGKEWLRAARLSCKQLYTPATVGFGRRFFTIPFVMVNGYSLQAVADVCAHPVFGPRVRGISFDAYRLDEWNPAFIYKKVTDSVLARDIDQIKAQGDKLQGYLDAYSEEFNMEVSGRAEDLLVKAFESIKQHDKPVSIALMATPDEIPIGYTRRSDNGVWNYQMKKTFRMLLSAVQRSQCRINKFTCQIPEISRLQSRTTTLKIAEIAASIGIFAELEYVQFEVYHYVDSFTAGLCGVLESAVKLCDLEFSTSPVYNKEIYRAKKSCQTTDTILRSVCSGTLRRVYLRSLVFKPELLKTFLTKHHCTLKEVLFDAVTLVGTWNDVLEWIRDNLSLQMLSLSDIRCIDASEFEDDDMGYFAEYWCDDVLWSSPEDIRLGLDQLLEEKRKEDVESDQGEL